jgi:hypothetical protein
LNASAAASPKHKQQCGQTSNLTETEKNMKSQTLFMGLISGLLGLFGCGHGKTTNEVSQTDTTKVQTINPNDILFTTPTLNNALPVFEEKTDTCAFFHEDEWRQIEFVSKNQKASIDKEIAKIKDIYDNQSHKGDSYVGYKNVAVRDLITEPLTVDFSRLKSYLTDKPIKMQGLGLENNPGQVKGGFFFNINGVNYYGLVDNNIVKTFCIYSSDSEQDLKSATDNLAKFLATEKLYLIDWRAMHVFDETNIKTDLVK